MTFNQIDKNLAYRGIEIQFRIQIVEAFTSIEGSGAINIHQLMSSASSSSHFTASQNSSNIKCSTPDLPILHATSHHPAS